MTSSERAPGMEHIPKYPRGFITLRILQLIAGLICLGLSAYTVAVGPILGNGVMVFTAFVTVATTLWIVSAHSCAKRSYNYWGILFFDVFLFIFWGIAFATTAFAAAVWLALGSYITNDYDSYWDYDYDYDYYTNFDFPESFYSTYGGLLAASAGIGALNFLFYFISLVIHGIVTSRHRRVGLPSKPVPVGSSAGQPYQMTGQARPTYAAVPQQGMPFTQQETAYNPHGMYGVPAPPQQQQNHQQHTSYYAPGTTQQEYYRNTPPQLSTSPAPTHPTVSDSFHRTPSPQAPQTAAYGAPYQPYQPPQ
ncbi:hypothetical protein ACO1O0_003326 [Amphichorda felina]